MDIRKQQRIVVEALEEIKARDIVVFNVSHLTSLFERVIIASGESARQVKALANSVAEKYKEAGGQVRSVEGADAGEWVLVDLGDLVVHCMHPAVRQYYNLEELWGQPKPRARRAKPASRALA